MSFGCPCRGKVRLSELEKFSPVLQNRSVLFLSVFIVWCPFFLSPCRVGDPNSQTLLCLSIFSKRKVMLEATVVIALYIFYQLYQKKKLEDKRVLNLGPLTKCIEKVMGTDRQNIHLWSPFVFSQYHVSLVVALL